MAKATVEDFKKAAKKGLKMSAKSSNNGLSQDKVVDSDSENETPAAKPAKKNVPETTAKKSKTPAKTLAKEPTPTDSSEEDSDESTDSEEEEKNVPTSKPVAAPAKTNGVKRKAEEQSSSSSEDTTSDSDESEPEQQPQAKKAKTKSASEEQLGKSSEHKARASPAAAPAKAQPPQAPVASIPAKRFDPPREFTTLPTASAKSLLSSTNRLAGKQIWHISAPSNVPISSIREVALSAVASGATVLTHKGVEYSLTQAKATLGQGDNILIPSEFGYQLLEQPIHTTLILQQKIVLPNLTQKQADLNTGSAAAADVGRAAFSTARTQPKGMRMRYKPPGFGQGAPGLGSDSEDGDEGTSRASGFQFPMTKGVSTAPASAEKKKKKRTASGEEELSKEERKRLKKEAKAKSRAA